MKKVSDSRKKKIAENLYTFGAFICFLFLVAGFLIVKKIPVDFGAGLTILLSLYFIGAGVWGIFTGYFRIDWGLGKKPNIGGKINGVLSLILGLLLLGLSFWLLSKY